MLRTVFSNWPRFLSFPTIFFQPLFHSSRRICASRYVIAKTFQLENWTFSNEKRSLSTVLRLRGRIFWQPAHLRFILTSSLPTLLLLLYLHTPMFSFKRQTRCSRFSFFFYTERPPWTNIRSFPRTYKLVNRVTRRSTTSFVFSLSLSSRQGGSTWQTYIYIYTQVRRSVVGRKWPRQKEEIKHRRRINTPG